MSQEEIQRLQDDISRLRRNLAQQLTETGDIVGAIREIDEVLYGGQYFAPDEDDDDDDFFADVRRARVLLTSLGNDLRHYQGMMAQLDEEECQDGANGNRLADWEHRLTEMDRQLSEARAELAAAANRQQALVDEADTLRQRCTSLEEQRRRETSADEGLANQLADARSHLEDLQGQIGSITWERDSLREDVLHQQERLQALEAEKVRIEGQLAEAVEAQRAAEDAVAQASAESADLRRRVTESEGRVSEYGEVQERLSALQQTLAERSAECEALRDEVATLNAGLGEQSAAAQQLAELQESLRAANGECERLQAAAEEALVRAQDAEEDGERLKRRQVESEDHLSVAIGERDRLRHELALAQARHDEALSALRKDLEQRHGDVLHMREAEIATLREKLATHESTIKGLHRDIEQQRSHSSTQGEDHHELKELRWQLENERTRHEEEKKSWQRRDGELRKLLEAARKAVLQAKDERHQRESVARSMIQDLQEQVAQLRGSAP